MRYLFILTGCLLQVACLPLHARQDSTQLSAAAEEQLEHNALAAADDMHWQQSNAHSRHRISLNTADAAALQSLGLLSPLQVSNFLAYRRLLGTLISVYELQAVPGFDTALIRRLLPYVSVDRGLQPVYTVRDYLRKGEHTLLWRYERQLELPRAYQREGPLPPHYAGSPDQLLFRWRYNFPRYAGYGITMEKDAGEQFFKGAQKHGFDFYSAHFFVKDHKCIKALVLGDFTVNMGQGLINWQSPAFGKSSLVLQVKREGEMLRPYISAGESFFFRGAGLTLQKGRWQVTGFVSARRLDGSTGTDDSLSAISYINALVTGGYHRSVTETAKKGVLQQWSAGAGMSYDNGNWRIGINVIQHTFSSPLKKGGRPYQRFALEGDRFLNGSLDYSGNWKQVHAFGEIAADAAGNIATVNGLLASVTPCVDISLLYRRYGRAYRSLYGNAFGNNARPVNESGWYTAVAVKITPHLRWEGYADLFRFPWLKYRVNAPSSGSELLTALTYTPMRQTEVFIRYRYSRGIENAAGGSNYIATLSSVTRHGWRWQVSMTLSPQWKLRSRIELALREKDGVKQQSWLCYHDLQYRFPAFPVRLSGRITWFSTGDDNLYALESGMLQSYSVQQLSGEGWQYNINLKWPITRSLALWLRWSQLLYRNTGAIGSGWDEIKGSRKSAIQLQVQQLF